METDPTLDQTERLSLIEDLRRTLDALQRGFHQTLREQYPEIRRTHRTVLLTLPSGGAGLTELAKQIGTTKQALSRPVAALIRMGYLVTMKNPVDGRAVRLLPTEKGSEYIRAADQAMAILEADAVSRLGSARMNELRQLLLAVRRPLR